MAPVNRPRRAWVDPADTPAPHAELPSGALQNRAAPIRVERLTKRYGDVVAIRNLSFTVQPGRVTGFLGPNGAGKTTTLRAMISLVTPSTGRARFGEHAYADLAHPQQTVGCVLDSHVHPARTGRNHLRVLAATAQVEDERVDELLDLVGLTAVASRPAGGYSLGMRGRLAMAGALLGDPEYLIMDEPANGLDPEGIRWLRTFIRRFAASGRTVLVASHLLSEVEATADDIVVIKAGRLLVQTQIAELDFDVGSCLVRVSHSQRARSALRELGVEIELLEDDQGEYLRVGTSDTLAVGTVLFNARIAIFELSRDRADLEDHFFEMLEAS